MTSGKNRKPILAITLGDPNGIGPEVILAMLGDPNAFSGECRLYGHRKILEEWLFRLRSTRHDLPGQIEGITILEPDLPPPPLSPGTPTREGGAASLACFEAAVRDALAGRVDAVVTAPISKEAWAMAGSEYRGHTRLLRDLCGKQHSVMMLANPLLRVALVTEHIPLSQVPEAITRRTVGETIRITAEGVRNLGVERPRVAVAGLNPHAGEGGLLGTEEQDIIAPAIMEQRGQGLEVSGPFPADTVFHRALKGEFDAVVALYHDQGLAPLKAVSFEDTVNITLGLPVIRTSVGHGTAFDLAGRGIANASSLRAALKTAELLIHGRSSRA